MAFANSLHKQYLGTTAGRGLMHAFTLLEKKGLTSVQTHGPFHQNLHDAIYHVAEAHFRTCWRVIAEVETLESLQSKSPVELLELAKQIVNRLAYLAVTDAIDALPKATNRLASSAAIDALDALPEAQQDQALHNSILWNRDVLRYIDLYEATRSGDVGIMEATLPLLAFRFFGGHNFNYLGEVLELLQCLHHEWPPELCDFVQQ
ncbi:hypothetical protein EV363DRAFT_1443741 [Boletus edulis]|nr:hypothetical protein EV363DRAFT_1443741 [Boletus edulis]